MQKYVESLNFLFLSDTYISDLVRYIKLNDRHCLGDNYGNYSTIQAATNACDADTLCQGVYDEHCEAGKRDITLCSSSAKYEHSLARSCIYQKIKNGN